MAVTDPIADYLTRIRNAQMASHKIVEIPASGLKKQITRILFEQGYILQYKVEEGEHKQEIIKIALKYDIATGKPTIQNLTRVSRPGLRKFTTADEMPRVINGLGLAIISTSSGVMTDKQAKKAHVGGEVLCYIY